MKLIKLFRASPLNSTFNLILNRVCQNECSIFMPKIAQWAERMEENEGFVPLFANARFTERSHTSLTNKKYLFPKSQLFYARKMEQFEQ